MAKPRFTAEHIHDLCYPHPLDADKQRRVANVRAASEAYMKALAENAEESADLASAMRHVGTAQMETTRSIAMEKPKPHVGHETR